MNTGSMMIISKKLLKQIGGGVDANPNPADAPPYNQGPVTLHGTIAPNGFFNIGVNVMVTPDIGIGTSITSTPNANVGNISCFVKW